MKGNANITWKLLTAVCLSAALSGCALLPAEEESLKPPLVKPSKEKFDLYEVKSGTIEKKVKGTATFVSSSTQVLFFKESGGRFLSFDVKLGDKVTKGQVVARLDKGNLSSRIRQQELNLEKATIILEQARRQSPGDEAQLRLKSIDVEAARLQLEDLREELRRTELVSDIGGIVTYLEEIQPGDSVTGFKPLITISNPDQVQLRYEASSAGDLTGVEVQMPAAVNYKGKDYKAKVVQTPGSAPLVKDEQLAAKNSKSLVIAVEGLPETVEIGDSADFSISTEKRENVLIIPRAGLRSYMGRDYVQVLEGESRKEIDVEKGIIASTEVEIRKGLKEGQQVIINN